MSDTDRPHREPGPDHPITIEPGNDRVLVCSDGLPVAASTTVLVLREKGYDPVLYIPRGHATREWLVPSETVTWCPYKGEASYYHLETPNERIEDAAWSYEDPFSAVHPIKGALAFDPAKVEVTMAALRPGPPKAVMVLQYWFRELTAEQHFKRDDAVDAEIAERFGDLHEEAAADRLGDWTRCATGMMGLVILLDQFSRNLHRDSADAFAQDDKALALARQAVARGYDLEYTSDRRAFLYMPYMHAEDLDAQEECIRLFKDRLPGTAYIRFAEEHRDIIKRFGRFPHRNRVLGRETTPEEKKYLEEGGASFA